MIYLDNAHVAAIVVRDLRRRCGRQRQCTIVFDEQNKVSDGASGGRGGKGHFFFLESVEPSLKELECC